MAKVALFVLSCVLAAAAQPNLGGVWEDKPQNAMVKIEQHGQTYDITVRAAGADVNYKTVVGKETPQDLRGVPVTIAAELDGNTITHVQTRRRGSGPETTETRKLTRVPEEAWSKAGPVVFAEAVYKNIQIMKGVPAPKLMDAMQNLTRWLGVECSHCHLPEHAELDC